MANICKEAEAAIWHNQLFSDLCSNVLPPIDATHAVAIASVEASIKCLAAAIIVITTSGRSAHLVSKYRPRCPIITVTRFEQVARQAHLWRGILPLHYSGKIIENFNLLQYFWDLLFLVFVFIINYFTLLIFVKLQKPRSLIGLKTLTFASSMV